MMTHIIIVIHYDAEKAVQLNVINAITFAIKLNYTRIYTEFILIIANIDGGTTLIATIAIHVIVRRHALCAKITHLIQYA
jgi:hypothetical protein